MRRYAADIVIADWMVAPMNRLELLRKVRIDPESPNPFVPTPRPLVELGVVFASTIRNTSPCAVVRI